MTVNREDYLKTIYELGGEKNKIGTKDIAVVLKVSLPSVSEMIKKLVDEGYIEYVLYKGVILTPSGLAMAKKIKKRHLLWEVFLVEKLGFDWEDVHIEAEMLEHMTSPKLEGKLEKYLNYPEVCPHGTPIEDHSYIFNYISLDRIQEGESVVIKRLEDEKIILKYSKQEGLNIGDTIKVHSKDQKRIAIIQDSGIFVEIKNELAKKIYVNKEML
ncbi:MAG TPA: metal-dependent transcriptional regulator [Epulopiscium sp.]|nr:metal-dependent transcriptional regulator [Candidatus Epulonipiscium sp.]